MSLSSMLDKTPAIRRRPSPATATGIDESTGEFVEEVPVDLAIKIHVSKVKGDEILPGGIHVEKGDEVVHLEKVLDVKIGDVLIYWGREHQVIAETRPSYDTVASLAGYTRRRLLVRELRPSDA